MSQPTPLPEGVQMGALPGVHYPSADEPERLDTVLSRPGFRVEQILSTGQATPAGEWYDQSGDEWVLLMEGTATIAFENGIRCPLQKGDWILLPARLKHRVESTSSRPGCIWLAIHVTPSGRL